MTITIASSWNFGDFNFNKIARFTGSYRKFYTKVKNKNWKKEQNLISRIIFYINYKL